MARRWCISTIRHGETDYNKEGRYAGTIDIPLNNAGRNDIRNASKQILSMEFSVAISSPLLRAIETARGLTDGQVKIILCSYAQERNYGILQGLTYAEVEEIRPPIHFIKIGGDFHSLNPPQAETFEELRTRAKSLYRYILDHYIGHKILVVSHAVFLQQFHGLLRGKDWIEALGLNIGNLELTTFQFEEDAVISEDRMYLTSRKQGFSF